MIGSNILKMAQQVIPPVIVEYYRFSDNVENDIGILEPGYYDPVQIKANVHPVPRSAYQTNGLDFNKKYIKLWTSIDVIDIDRDISSDRIEYNGEIYQLINKTDWMSYDKWNWIMGVRIDR